MGGGEGRRRRDRVCVCARARARRREDIRRTQNNYKSNTLEKRKDLWFLTLYGVPDHPEKLIKAIDFSRKQQNSKHI